MLFIVGAGEIPNNNKGRQVEPLSDIITSVSPDSANTGDNFTLTINLDESLGTPPIPPSNIVPDSVAIGDIEGTNIQRNNFVVTATFNIPETASAGKKTIFIEFPAPPDQQNAQPMVFSKMDAFEIISTAEPGSLVVNIKPDLAAKDGAQWKLDNGSWQNSGATVSDLSVGTHTITFSGLSGWNVPLSQDVTISSGVTEIVDATYTEASEQTLTYPVVDTNQTQCFNTSGGNVSCTSSGSFNYGQDAQHTAFSPNYTDNGDGTITDNITGLMWQKNAGEKMTFEEAVSNASSLNLAGYTDWRLPSIKELYSLILFSGKDISGYESTDTSSFTPFINSNYFDFEYGDTSAGERLIDSQFASSTEYVSTTMDGDHTVFGVNFADGRIKGYGTQPIGNQTQGKTFFVLYVRGNSDYGKNNFSDNGDSTITDNATGLMWTQTDSQNGLNWGDAIDYCDNLQIAGFNDWRLPNAKELQSIVDYTRSPDTTSSAAIDPMFDVTSIKNEEDATDYPYYWSSTTHINMQSGGNSAYLSFGRAMGNMNGNWMDVHGAGSQRSDPKTGNPADYPTGHGPQGDANRIYNYARCVRDAVVTTEIKTGSLIVNILPQEAIDDGMQWKVDNGSWQDSAETVSNLSVGKHTVSFKTDENWTSPKDQEVTITDGETLTITGTFTDKTTPGTCNPGDLDANGKINLKDVIILLQKFVDIEK